MENFLALIKPDRKTWKRVKIFVFALSALLLLSCITPAYSAPAAGGGIIGTVQNGLNAIGAGIGKFLGKTLNAVVGPSASTMANQIVSGIGEILSETGYAVGDNIFSSIVGGFGPTTDELNKNLGGASILNRFVQTADLFGYILATVLLVVSLIKFFFAPPGELKDTPVRLFLRYIVTILLIYNSQQIVQIFLDLANQIWTGYIMTDAVWGGKETVSFDAMLPGSILPSDGQSAAGAVGGAAAGVGAVAPAAVSGATVVLALFGVSVPIIVPILAAVASIWFLVVFIVAWPLIKGFIMFYIEIVERYLVVMLLFLFSGAVMATFVSKDTQRIVKSYFSMLASQLFLLLVNGIFMSVFTDILLAGGWTSSVPQYVFGITFLKVAQRLDSYMASLGLTVAQTGGRALDELLGVAMAAREGFRAISSGFSKNAPKAASSAAASAARSGNFERAARLQGAADILSGRFSGANETEAQAAADAAAKYGVFGEYSTDADTAAGFIADFMANPSSQTAANRVAALDQKSLTAGLNKTLKGQGYNIKDANFTAKKGTFSFSGTNAAGEDVTGTYTTMGSLGRADKINGGWFSASDRNQGQNDTSREAFRGNAEAVAAHFGYGGTASSMPEADRSRIASGIPGSNGRVNLYDANHNSIGMMTKIGNENTYVPNYRSFSKDLSATDNDRARKQVQTGIERSLGLDSGSARFTGTFSDNGRTVAKFTATQTDFATGEKKNRVVYAAPYSSSNGQRIAASGKNASAFSMNDLHGNKQYIAAAVKNDDRVDTEAGSGPRGSGPNA